MGSKQLSAASYHVSGSQIVLEYWHVCRIKVIFAPERGAVPSGCDALSRFRQAAVAALALLKIEQGLQ
jgi:hypothetical protein